MFMQVVAPHMHIDWESLLWCHQIALNTSKSVQIMLKDLGVVLVADELEDGRPHIDIRMETLMPKVKSSVVKPIFLEEIEHSRGSSMKHIFPAYFEKCFELSKKQ